MFWVLVGLLDGAGGGAPPEQQVITAGRYYPIYKKPEPEKEPEKEQGDDGEKFELPPIKVEAAPQPIVIRLDTGDVARISESVAREIRQAIEDDDEDAIAAILSVIL